MGADPWDNTPYDRLVAPPSYIPRNHGGLGHSPVSDPASTDALDTLRKKQETAAHVKFLRDMALGYGEDGLLEESDRLTKIADQLEGKS